MMKKSMKNLNLKRSGMFEGFSYFQSGETYDAIGVKIKMTHSTSEEEKEKGFNKSTLKIFIFFYLFFSLFMVTRFCLRCIWQVKNV